MSNQWTGYSNTLSSMKGGDSGENIESLARFPIVLNTEEDYTISLFDAATLESDKDADSF